jgi:Sulfotransferase family
MMHDVIFVAGAPRSGTTLFRLILDSHPSVVNPGEFDFLFDLVSDDAKFPDLNKYAEWLSTNRIFLSHQLTIDPNLGYCDLVRSFVRQKTHSKCIVALGVHRGHHKIPLLFPEAKYIHLLRDPRDVALSTIQMGWAGNVLFAVDRWIEAETSWDRLALKVEKSRILEIKYEDLVSKPQDTLRVVCNFLNIEFDGAMLNYFRHSSYEPVHANSVRKWKKTVKPKELAVLEHKMSALLLDRGYDLSGVQIRKPSRGALAVLWARHKAFQWRFGARRYGIAIFLSEKIAHAFGMTWLNRRVRLAINEIDKLDLK